MKVLINGNPAGVALGVRKDGNKVSVETIILYKALLHQIPDLEERADISIMDVGDLDFHSGDVDVGSMKYIDMTNSHWFVKGEPETGRNFPPVQHDDIITLRC